MRLSELEGEKHLATVQLGPERTVVAEFLLDGRQSYLQLYSEEPLNHWPPPPILLATLPDGTRLTFLDNVILQAGTRPFLEGRSHFMRVQPHWVAVGRHHLTEDARLSSLDVLVDDAATIFYDFDAFGYASSPENYIDAILSEDSQGLGRTIARGERPIIGYFAGRWTICASDTAVGWVSAHHSLSQSMGGPSGIELTSRIFAELQPPSPVTLVEAVDAFMSVLRFLEMVAGRPQNVLAVVARVASQSEIPEHLEIYWPFRPTRPVDVERPHPADIPLNGGIDPAAFSAVMARWLDADATRREARIRYATATANQNSYGVDRLVGVANMFDVLPPDALPETNDLPAELASARDAARELFRPLSQSPERDSVLGALGRIGQSNLKRKVRHRASFISGVAASRFPELDLVVDEAVNCRNRYVHGSTSRIDYTGAGRELVPFLTDALEFVFGASELVEAGWDLMEWLGRGTTMSHPWGTFRVGYARNLSRLKALLPAGAS